LAPLVFKTSVGLDKALGGFDPIHLRQHHPASRPGPPRFLMGTSMLRRIPQPPINLSVRGAERHDFWAGFVLGIIGLVVLLCGTQHLTDVDTVEGNTAWESQLIKAFASGGLEYVDLAAPPDPSAWDDPVTAAAALAQMERSSGKGARMKLRVNTGAANPCPT